MEKEGNGPIESIYILVESKEVQDHCHCELERLFGQDEISARPKRGDWQARQEPPPAPRNSHMHVVHGACSSALHTSCQNVTRTSHHSNNCNCNCNGNAHTHTHTPLLLPFSPRRGFQLVYYFGGPRVTNQWGPLFSQHPSEGIAPRRFSDISSSSSSSIVRISFWWHTCQRTPSQPSTLSDKRHTDRRCIRVVLLQPPSLTALAPKRGEGLLLVLPSFPSSLQGKVWRILTDADTASETAAGRPQPPRHGHEVARFSHSLHSSRPPDRVLSGHAQTQTQPCLLLSRASLNRFSSGTHQV